MANQAAKGEEISDIFYSVSIIHTNEPDKKIMGMEEVGNKGVCAVISDHTCKEIHVYIAEYSNKQIFK